MPLCVFGISTRPPTICRPTSDLRLRADLDSPRIRMESGSNNRSTFLSALGLCQLLSGGIPATSTMQPKLSTTGSHRSALRFLSSDIATGHGKRPLVNRIISSGTAAPVCKLCRHPLEPSVPASTPTSIYQSQPIRRIAGVVARARMEYAYSWPPVSVQQLPLVYQNAPDLERSVVHTKCF
jgi:hypothetical protein